jgi:hypothetical protein
MVDAMVADFPNYTRAKLIFTPTYQNPHDICYPSATAASKNQNRTKRKPNKNTQFQNLHSSQRNKISNKKLKKFQLFFQFNWVSKYSLREVFPYVYFLVKELKKTGKQWF